MKAVGVVVEYNPFHNGHAYHLRAAKEASEANIVIAVMSGSFLQRGEPAFASKWTRAEMALRAGADIVFELPYQFAVQQADTFAAGAVSILEAAKCKFLCFGSESGDITHFQKAAAFFSQHEEEYQASIRQFLEIGNSYPKAASLAARKLQKDEDILDLTLPNNILGYQYVKSIIKQNASITPLTIKRKNAGYHDQSFTSADIASATSIRKTLFTDGGSIKDISPFVPHSTYSLMLDYQQDFGTFHHWELYWPFLQYRLLHLNAEELSSIYEMEEGLEHRFLAAALKADSFHHFMTLVKTKRYTWTRLQRACVHILTNSSKEEMKGHEKADYLRLLGMTANGRSYLNKYKNDLGLPLISRVSSSQGAGLALDIKASRVFGLAAGLRNKEAFITQDFTQPPIIV
ncbi:nucleotidyltransferase [Cytobacillus gottheilii]|uniref:nucleotidyltransferase n=1 Tax=Cytobacillus gottheilii TaxID=859144 RepID=UPI0009B9FDF3|nr:nucleotidyltransferase [Cytobacillus gottheilii]